MGAVRDYSLIFHKFLPIIRAVSLTVIFFVALPVGYAEEPATIDDLGFSTVTDGRLFSSGVQTQSGTFPSDNKQSARFENTIDVEPVDNSSAVPFDSGYPGPFRSSSGADNLDFIASSYQQSRGFKINRLSTSWFTEKGTLTVGSDWAGFQDLLSIDKQYESAGSAVENRSVASQIKWLSANGFSISLEDSPKTSTYDSEDGSSPGLILSWQGVSGGEAGRYRVTAMGKKLGVDTGGESSSGSDVIGWGLNLEGGWQIGDLFAALSVTFGKGVDSYILQRYGDDLIVTPNHPDASTDSLSIKPSLYYSLNNNSNFHVALGHYTSDESSNSASIDTLDTIHMGYSWNPWPSTQFGLELVGSNANDKSGVATEYARFKFDAKKRF